MFKEYLRKHGIDDESVKNFGLYEKNDQLVIPIKDIDGRLLYNKYRHLNFNKDSNVPKFSFDRGSYASLFNSNIINTSDKVIIAEGEPDCIKLTQEGFSAVTGTTGASNFKDEWIELLVGKCVYICLDNDTAGMKGKELIANKLNKNNVDSYIIDLPKKYKDICEYFVDNDKKNFVRLMDSAIPANESLFTRKQENDEISILSWKEFSSKKFEEPKWIVENIIPERGLVALSGAPESCKSLFTNYLAVCILKGETLLEKYNTLKTPILLLDQENLPAWLQKRIKQFSDSINDAPLYVLNRSNKLIDLLDEKHFEFIKNFIKKHKIGLIIVDTLRYIHNREENSSTDMKLVFERLKDLTELTAVLFIHHHRKSDKFGRRSSSGEEMMGSIFILGSVDSHITLSRIFTEPNQTKVKLTHTKSRYVTALNPIELALEGNENHLHFKYLGDAKDFQYKKDEAKEIVIQELELEELKKQDLINRIVNDGVCSKRTLETAIKELEEEKKINHKSRPYIYFLTDKSTKSQDATLYIDYEIANTDHE